MNSLIERSFITIAVTDWPQSLKFYQCLLQLPPQALQPDRYAEFHPPGCTMALYVARPEESSQPTDQLAYPSMSLCLQVKSISAILPHLQMLDYEPPAGIQYSSHGAEIYVYDPNGNRIILYEPNHS